MKKNTTTKLLACIVPAVLVWTTTTQSLAQTSLPMPRRTDGRAAPVRTPAMGPTPAATAIATPPYFAPTPYPTPRPSPTISWRDANSQDVAMCTSLAAAIATLAWNAGAIGSAANWANTTVAELIGMNPNTLAGLQMLAGALGYSTMPDDWMQLSLEQFFSTILRPGWDSCKLIVENFTSLPATFQILTEEPDFWVPRPNDSPGVSMGRSCAEQWRNGRRALSLQGCQMCCEQNLSNPARQQSCKAVCQAQFS